MLKPKLYFVSLGLSIPKQNTSMYSAPHRGTQARISRFVHFVPCSFSLEMAKYKITHATKYISMYIELIFNIRAFIADSQVIGIGFISPT